MKRRNENTFSSCVFCQLLEFPTGVEGHGYVGESEIYFLI